MPMKKRHINNGDCPKCDEIFDKDPNFHAGLRAWFKSLQSTNVDAHISCATRGEAEQNRVFKAGYSRAVWGQSAHNYGMAIDIFRQTQQGTSYDTTWFRQVVGEAVQKWNKENHEFRINWYGAPGTRYFELPHCEVMGWIGHVKKIQR